MLPKSILYVQWITRLSGFTQTSSKMNTQNVIHIKNITSGLRLSDLTLLKIWAMSFKPNEV